MERKIEAKFALYELHPEAAINAFVLEDSLRAWWKVSDTLIETKPGGLYILAWENDGHGFDYITSGLVRSFRRNNHLLLDKVVYMNPTISILGPMSLDIRIVNDGVTNWLRVIQYGFQEGQDWDWYYEAVRVGWPQALNQLANFLRRQT